VGRRQRNFAMTDLPPDEDSGEPYDKEPLSDEDQPSDDLPRPDPLVCPSCGSSEIRRMPRLALAIVGIIFVLVFDVASWGSITEVSGIGVGIVILVVIMLGRWRCRDCGHGWK
jgi:hypothetical protein